MKPVLIEINEEDVQNLRNAETRILDSLGKTDTDALEIFTLRAIVKRHEEAVAGLFGMTPEEKLTKAIRLLREWIYEMTGVDDLVEDDVKYESLSRDYDRMSANTIHFLEDDCGVDMENT